MLLKNKIAVITGGSGGISSVVAETLAHEGAKIFVLDRDSVKLRQAVARFSRQKLSVYGLRCDVSKEREVESAVKKIVKSGKRIDILVNCAGIQAPIGPFSENNFSEWVRNVQINLLGTVLVTKNILPQMIKQKNGSIINFSGGGSTSSRPNFSAYAVSKIGVVKFTEILADEVKKYGVRVNAVSPGAVNTAMLKEVIRAGKRAGAEELRGAKLRAKKGGTPPELAAQLVAFLASPKSDGLTGKLISAPWDDWRHWTKKDITAIMKSDKYTLRRVK